MLTASSRFCEVGAGWHNVRASSMSCLPFLTASYTAAPFPSEPFPSAPDKTRANKVSRKPIRTANKRFRLRISRDTGFGAWVRSSNKQVLCVSTAASKNSAWQLPSAPWARRSSGMRRSRLFLERGRARSRASSRLDWSEWWTKSWTRLMSPVSACRRQNLTSLFVLERAYEEAYPAPASLTEIVDIRLLRKKHISKYLYQSKISRGFHGGLELYSHIFTAESCTPCGTPNENTFPGTSLDFCIFASVRRIMAVSRSRLSRKIIGRPGICCRGSLV